MKRFTLIVLAAFLVSLAPVMAGILYVTPPFLTLDISKNRQGTLYLTPPKEYSPQWDLLKGSCYQWQIASAHVHGWVRYGNNQFHFPVTVSAVNPGSCEMWFKAGDAEVKVLINVQR